MSGQHTPGPWIVKSSVWLGGSDSLSAPGVFSVEDAATGTVICDRRTAWPSMAHAMEANARLIAAAPDMLAALRYAVDNPEFDSAEFDRLARSALAKAAGSAS